MSESTASSVYGAYQGNTYLFGGNAPYVEEMYENYLSNPGSVPDNWRSYFDALQNVPAADGTNTRDVPHLPVINAFAERAKQGSYRAVVLGFSTQGRDLGPRLAAKLDAPIASDVTEISVSGDTVVVKHPGYANKVTVTLSTHSQGGLTENDFELASQIESLA